jgi:hypothetical protein
MLRQPPRDVMSMEMACSVDVMLTTVRLAAAAASPRASVADRAAGSDDSVLMQ